MKKFVSLLLSVALPFLTIPLASAQYSVKTTEEVGYSDAPAFYFFSQIGIIEDANAKAMITATVLHLLQKAQNSSEYGQGFYRLDKEAPVLFATHSPVDASGVLQILEMIPNFRMLGKFTKGVKR